MEKGNKELQQTPLMYWRTYLHVSRTRSISYISS